MTTLKGPVTIEFDDGSSLRFDIVPDCGIGVFSKNTQGEIEFYGHDGTSFRPILTLLTAPGANYVQVRKPDDKNSIIIGFQQAHIPYIATEIAGTNFRVAPRGKLELPSNSETIKHAPTTST